MSIESSGSTTNPGAHSAWWTPRLAGPVIAAAVVRLTLLALIMAHSGISDLFQGDTISYLEPGRNLLLHGRFFADGAPDLVRTPGYPLFLAITSLAGFPAAAVANVMLSIFSVILVWKLGRVVFGDNRIALGAAWIFAFEPISIANSSGLISDTLFLALLLLCMERIAAFLRGHRLPVLAAAGLWLTAATFVRPITYFLPFALAPGLFLALVRVPGLRWKAPAVLLISVLPWMAAWQIRNSVETGYHGFSSISEISLYFQVASGVTARVEHRPYVDVRKDLGYFDFTNNSGQFYLYPPYLAQHPEQAGWNQGQRLAFMHSEGVRIIRSHFGIYLNTSFTSLLRTVFISDYQYFNDILFPGNSNQVTSVANLDQRRWTVLPSKKSPHAAVERAAFGVVLLGLYLFATRAIFLAVKGVFRLRMNTACLWLLLGTSLYFLAVTAVGEEPGGIPRYRLPVMPVICILAAAGFRRAKTVGDSKFTDRAAANP